jgi:hypothetical protein
VATDGINGSALIGVHRFQISIGAAFKEPAPTQRLICGHPALYEPLPDCRSFTVNLPLERVSLETRANLTVSGALDPPVITKDMA